MPGSTLAAQHAIAARQTYRSGSRSGRLPVVLGLFLPGSVVPGGFVEGGSTRDVAARSQAFGSDGGAAMLASRR